MFCAPGLVFGVAECVGSRFHVLRSMTRFRWYRERRDPFSCFALADSFSAVRTASGPIFMFCTPELVFGCSECVGSHFHVFDGAEGVGSRFKVLRSRNHFRRYRGRRVSFSSFGLPDSFSVVPSASGPVFLFCAPVLVFGGAECVGSRFHVLRARTHFQQYRGRRDPFSCFALPESFSRVPREWGPFSCSARPDGFSTVPSASRPVFMFYAPGLIFGGTEGVGSRFHVLRSRTRFR
jgi:hypothetical protein